MQRAVAVFVHPHARALQVVVQQAGCCLHDGHVGLALQDQPHVHAPLCGPLHLSDEAVAREEVGIGNHHPAARRAQGHAVLALDIVGVLLVVARHKHGVGCACVGAAGNVCGVGALVRAAVQHRLAREAVHLRHNRAAHLHGVVLLGLGAEVGHVVG